MRESGESMGAKKVADLTHRTIEASSIARMGVTAKTKAAREKSLIVRFMQEFTYHGQSTEKRLKEGRGRGQGPDSRAWDGLPSNPAERR